MRPTSTSTLNLHAQGVLEVATRVLHADLAYNRPVMTINLHLGGQMLAAHVHDGQASGSATNLAQSDGAALIRAGEGLLEGGALVDFVRWSDA